ncbi:YceI family protein [Luteimonas sp. BDR2-5]|uniref:YceI family protein n=1 Tax=Proluteimonas luteida TaxID=2878685 RepID=UPI001E4C96A1|nr:YceI family protein [Luteimonas sp. BDR2-5]MCD9029863.1 YceI family protein [Luteimonas sp. BDR2-5]
MSRSPRFLIAAALAAALPFSALAADYVQAPGSSLAFAGKYQGETFSGIFPGFSTTLRFDPVQLDDAALSVTIPLASATTRNDDYDGEMRGPSFFDATRFAQATYTATRFRDLGNGQFAADGELTLRGIRRPVTLTFTWTPGNRPLLSGRATVRRLDFDVGAGEWADTATIPNEIAVSTRVYLQPSP